MGFFGALWGLQSGHASMSLVLLEHSVIIVLETCFWDELGFWHGQSLSGQGNADAEQLLDGISFRNLLSSVAGLLPAATYSQMAPCFALLFIASIVWLLENLSALSDMCSDPQGLLFHILCARQTLMPAKSHARAVGSKVLSRGCICL